MTLDRLRRVLHLDHNRRACEREQSTREQQQEYQGRLADVQARLDRIQMETERPAMRHGYQPPRAGMDT